MVSVTNLNAKTLRRHVDRKLTRQLRQLWIARDCVAHLLCRALERLLFLSLVFGAQFRLGRSAWCIRGARRLDGSW